MKYSLGISNFLEETSRLAHSVVFLYFFALIIVEGFLISLLFFGALHSDACIFPFLLCFSLLFFSQLFDVPRQHIKKQRHYFAHKGLSHLGYCSSSSHVWMGELDCKESWVPKNWCFWTLVLEKTLESPLDCKKIQPVHPKGHQSLIFIGRTDAEAATSIFDHLMWKTNSLEKTLMLGKIDGKRRKGQQRMRWHHWLDGHELEQAPGVGDG